MRVAILIRRFSTRGGNERQAVELARQLVRRDHDVEVYCHKADDTADGIVDPAAVKILGGIRFDPTAAMLSYAWATRRLVHRLRAEDVVTIGFGHSVVQDVYRLGGGTHAEFLALTAQHPKARGGPVLDRVALRLERARMKPSNTRHFVAVSQRTKAELVRHYAVDESRIHVIENGTNLERFHPDGDDLRAEWGIDGPIALFVGQDPFRKGLDVAIEAAHRAKLTLVYVGPERPEGVFRAGELRDIERAYRAADVLVAPSRYDPFGGVVLEAAACGLPAVATRRIGATERFFGTALDDLLVEDPEDVDGIATRLERAVADPSLGALARRTVERATLEAWGDAMIHVLDAARSDR